MGIKTIFGKSNQITMILKSQKVQIMVLYFTYFLTLEKAEKSYLKNLKKIVIFKRLQSRP